MKNTAYSCLMGFALVFAAGSANACKSSDWRGTWSTDYGEMVLWRSAVKPPASKSKSKRRSVTHGMRLRLVGEYSTLRHKIVGRLRPGFPCQLIGGWQHAPPLPEMSGFFKFDMRKAGNGQHVFSGSWAVGSKMPDKKVSWTGRRTSAVPQFSDNKPVRHKVVDNRAIDQRAERCMKHKCDSMLETALHDCGVGQYCAAAIAILMCHGVCELQKLSPIYK